MRTTSNSLLSRRGVSLERLRTLVMVADKGCIAAAAGKPNLTAQSQFSRQLKELETCFECKLTERRGRTLSLTSAGLKLAAIAREHFLALERFVSESGGKGLTIRIGAGESILNWLLIPALDRIQKADITTKWQLFNLQAEDIQNRLMDQRIDFGIMRSLSSAQRLKSVKLGFLDTVMFVPRALLQGMRLSPSILPQLPLALLEGTSRIREAIEQSCRKRKGVPRVVFECTSAVQIASLVASAQAAGPLPTIARHLFDGEKVAEMPLGTILEKDKPLLFVWNPRTLSTNPQLERLRRQLIDALDLSGIRSQFPKERDGRTPPLSLR